MLNLSLIVLQSVPPLCDYEVWIDIERGVEAKRYLCNMVELNMIEEFCAYRMAEHKRAAYLAMLHEMAHEEYKEKRDEEGAWKREKARRANEAYARGGRDRS
jgi:hypothetical protein